jgi:hypothetical protein
MLLFNLHLTIDDQYYSNFPKLLGNVFLGSAYMSSLTIFPLEILEFCLDSFSSNLTRLSGIMIWVSVYDMFHFAFKD